MLYRRQTLLHQNNRYPSFCEKIPMTEKEIIKNKNSALCVRERFRFLFNNLDIDEFKLISAKKEKIMLDEKIKKIKTDIRRQKRREKVWNMAQNMQNEINNYLAKASKPKDDFRKNACG